MMKSTASTSDLRAGAIPVMAAGCGIMVSNVYLGQPLLSAIAHSFGVAASKAGAVATAAQVGYALGILLIVPLADRANIQRLVRVLMTATCIALLGAALSPTIEALVVATLAMTISTVIPQMLIPLAVARSAPERAGRVLGVMQSGLILGILLSRTVSGSVAQYAGSWRYSYFLAAALTFALLCILPRYLPARQAQAESTDQPSYSELLRSLPGLLVRFGDLRLSCALGALVFGAFSVFWATLAFHLAEPPFEYGSAKAGMFGLWGAAGALAAPLCGRLSDRYGPSVLNSLAIVAAAVAFALMLFGGDVSVLAIVIGVNLIDFGNQAGQIANQARIFKLAAAARARLNTVYMVATFSGGAIGSALGTAAWQWAGWSGVCATGLLLLFSAGLLLLARHVSGRRAVQ